MDDLECDKLEKVEKHRGDEIEMIEADELGWSVVYKNKIFYYKKTTKTEHATINLYMPLFKDNRKHNSDKI